jgi:hypothetical protein
MFLDDELLEMCKASDCSTPEIIQELNTALCRKCEQHYKSNLETCFNNRDIKALLDKTFNLFDSFVRTALKSDDNKLRLLGEVFQEHSFKKQLLSNPTMLEIYNKL